MNFNFCFSILWVLLCAPHSWADRDGHLLIPSTQNRGLRKQVTLRSFLSSAKVAGDGEASGGLSEKQQFLLSKYMTNEELAEYMTEYIQRCSNIAKKISIGKSGNGVDMWAITISSSKGEPEASRPSFKMVANMHGDEPSGRTLLMLLAEKLCSEYKKDAQVTALVDDLHLVLVPTVNPDGFANRRRGNMKNVDLNRNFPDPIQSPKGTDLRIPQGKEEPETLAIMNFTMQFNFIASLGFHEGALVANYPLDGYPDSSQQMRKTMNKAPDHATFVSMASKYATLHTTMSTVKNNEGFEGGITNGAQWYPVYGGMQDWNYFAAGCMDITLELNDRKWPDMKRLTEMWHENEAALVEYPMAVVYSGFRGQVHSFGKRSPIQARIEVEGINHTVSSNEGGFYFRPLVPGSYKVKVYALEYTTALLMVEVPKGTDGVVLDVALKPIVGTPAAKADILTPVVKPAAKIKEIKTKEREGVREGGKAGTGSELILISEKVNQSDGSAVETGIVVVDRLPEDDLGSGQLRLTYVFAGLGLVGAPVLAAAIYFLCVKRAQARVSVPLYHK